MMIEKIINWSVTRRWAVLFLAFLGSCWGAWSFLSLPIDAVPDITNVQVQVNATSQGLAPEDLEAKVTYPMEIAMGGIPGVQQIRSLTKFGLSQVTIVFEDSADIYRARQLVTEKLQTLTSLPPGVNHPTLSPISTGLGEIFHYTIKMKNTGDREKMLMQAREIQEWNLKPRLLTVPGVAEVNTIGGFARQVQVQPDIKKLASYKLSLTDLKEALMQSNRNTGGSYIRENENQLLIQASGQFSSLDDIRNVPVKSLQNLRTVLIQDVAEVRFAGAVRVGAALVDGQEAVIGTVMMLSGANSRTVAKAVSERVLEIQNGNELPEGAQIIPLYDRSDLVDATLNTVIHNLLVGAALVIIVLFLLLGNIKAALVVSLSIPITLLLTFGIMKSFGISGNLMSLGALDFGIIVDGAVIVVDHCVRWIQDRHKKMNTLEKISSASKEIRHAAGFGQMMVIVVFLPIIGLGGIEGKMFRPMAETFSIALALALLLSFTLIPALSAILFSENESDHEPWLMHFIQKLYVPFLETALKFRWPIMVISGALMAIATFVFTLLGAEFLPRLDEGSLVLQLVRPVTTNLEASVTQQAVSEKIIKEFGAVKGVFSRVGTGEVATDPMGPNEADTFIQLKDRSSWSDQGRTFKNKDQLTEALTQKLKDALPLQEISATQPIQMRFNDLLEGTRADLTMKLYGDNLEQLMNVTHEIAQTIKGIPGSGDVLPELKGGLPLLQVVPKFDVLSKYSLSAAPVLDAISIGMAGEETGFYYEGLRRIPLLVKLDDKIRNDQNKLKSLQVYGGPNFTLPLEQVAKFEKRKVLSPILREGSKRRSAVLINPRGRDVETFVEQAKKRISETIRLPEGYRMEWFGSFKNLQDAKQRLIVLAPLALVLVSAMIFWAFGTVIETLIVLATVPLALVGGVLGLALTHIPFSISAAVGFIALSGIAVLNGVVLVHYFKELREQKDCSGTSWIIEGAKLRLRPVLMTALVDVFGFIPMAISTGVGSEVQKPLATVVIGGILTSTLLTLIVLPVVTFGVFKKRSESNFI